MVRLQYKLLIFSIIILFCSSFIYGQDLLTGIWKTSIHRNSVIDTYLCIEKVSDDEYFVVYVDPVNKHQLDYAEYGYVDEDGYLVINLRENVFYIKYENGYIYHNWNEKQDMNAYIFTRVVSKSEMESENDNNMPDISLEDFAKSIQSQINANKDDK